MADNSGGGSTTILAFIVGALLIAVVGLFFFRGMPAKQVASGPSITITAPAKN
ncbi:MAG: hypothetical protein V4601_11330 [Pseudomonadota bacterium]